MLGDLMTEITFEELANRLTAEALNLFREMSAAHLESTGDRFFILTSTFGGASLHFVGKGSGSRHTFGDVDPGALNDLASWNLLHIEYGQRDPNYRVTGEGQRFYRWLMLREGSAVEQVEAVVRRLISGSEYAKAHPNPSHHLREAFELLWSGLTDDPVVSEIGDHMRKALMDAVSDLVGLDAGGWQEEPISRLKDHVVGLGLATREAEVVSRLVDLARSVLRLDNRLVHIRDETDRGERRADWEEIRRAAFATSFVCYELGRIQAQREDGDSK